MNKQEDPAGPFVFQDSPVSTGVEPEEVEEACHANPFVKRGRGRKSLKMYEVYGRGAAGRYLFIVVRLVEASDAIVITARDMTDSERKMYRGRRS